MSLSDQLERIAAAGIQLLPVVDIQTHYVFYRDGFAALVERAEGGFGAVGSSGLLTEQGYAALVWRSGRAFFVGRTYERPAGDSEVQSLRRFAADLEQAVREL